MKSSLLKSAGLLIIITFISKAIGFVREIIIAYYYGASFSTDAYFLAMGLISNVLYAFTTALSVAFLPLYIENKRKSRSQNFVSVSCIVTGVISIAVSGIVFVCSEGIAKLTAPSYNAQQLYYVGMYMRILAVGMLFPLFTNIFTSILNAERIYGYTAFSGIIYSMTIIFFSLVLQKRFEVLALVAAVPISYFLQCLILFWRAKKFILFGGRLQFRNSDIDVLVKNAVPILLSNAVVELNQFIDRFLAVRFGDGAVSALSYSKTLSSFLASLFISTIITMFFTELSYMATGKDTERFLHTFKGGFSSLIILTLPIVYIIWFCSEDIVNIIYGRGAFDSGAVIMTAQVLRRYGIGFTFTILQAYLVKVFYALEDTKNPMKNGVICVAANIMLSVVLSYAMGFGGIALGTSIATMMAVIMLIVRLIKRMPDLKNVVDGRNAWRIMAVSAVVYVLMTVMNHVFAWSGSYSKLVINGLVCFGAYFVGLVIAGCQEAVSVWENVRRDK